MTLRAVLFDLDGTLRHNRPSWPDLFLDTAQRLGVPVPPEARRGLKRWAHRFWAGSDELLEMLRTHGEGEPSFWQAYTQRRLEILGCSPEKAAELAPRILEELRAVEEPPDVVPDPVPATLEALHRRGYRLAVLTNRSEPLNGYLSEIGLEGYFDLALAAGEVGLWKPNPAIFHHTVERLGIAPHEAAYVGDNLYADVLGAQAAGLHPVLLDPEGLFPEAPCPVITCLDQLPAVLEQLDRERASAA
ncbi:MAG TPA: HAD family hydrolase [Anaerolineae bacterium]|nr:HAD family hydrolase [Anaerolineae bacterium]HID83540.1 HAD family hydrolase [Anaerolineales bacterium]